MYVPAPNTWKSSVWRALDFELLGPHRYAYEVEMSGEGAPLGFTARAVGDLDCDGVLSTFEQRGAVDSEGRVKSLGFFSKDELE